MPPIVAVLIGVVVILIALAVMLPNTTADDLRAVQETAPPAPAAVMPSSPADGAVPPLTHPPALYATFPRRLNALTTDGLILIVISLLVVLAPTDALPSPLRATVAGAWWATLLLYEPVLVARFGGTIGHRLFNLRVVDEYSGDNISLGKALLRFWIKGFLGIVSFFSMSLSRRHQAIHDLLTHSTVQIRDHARAAPHHYVTGRDTGKPPGAT
jgi:uncharacterized RDD family membrane protein YckC